MCSSVPSLFRQSPEDSGNPHHDEHAELGVALVGRDRDIRCGRRVRMRAGGIAASHLTMCGERSPPFDSPLLKRAKGLGAGRPSWGDQGKDSTHSPPLSIYSSPRGLRQDPGRAAESAAGARTSGIRIREVRVLACAPLGGMEQLAEMQPQRMGGSWLT